MNRDERRDRAPARPPRRWRGADGGFTAPVDGDAGGTWIAAKDSGVVLALLNHQAPDDSGVVGTPAPGRRISRGLLVDDAGGANAAPPDAARLRAAGLRSYAPFRLFVAGPSRAAARVHLERRHAHDAPARPAPRLPDQFVVEPARRDPGAARPLPRVRARAPAADACRPARVPRAGRAIRVARRGPSACRATMRAPSAHRGRVTAAASMAIGRRPRRKASRRPIGRCTRIGGKRLKPTARGDRSADASDSGIRGLGGSGQALGKDRRGDPRQVDGEDAPVPGEVASGEAAVVGLDAPSTEGQAESEAGAIAGLLLERMEQRLARRRPAGRRTDRRRRSARDRSS